jgi:acyl dehydratase
MTDPESARLEALMTPGERRLFDLFRSWVGREFNLKEAAPRQAVEAERDRGICGFDSHITRRAIRRWTLANDDPNPLWHDKEAALHSRWGEVVAPPLFLLAIDDGVSPVSWLIEHVYGTDGVVNTRDYPNFAGGLQGSTEFEFFLPVRLGDTIEAAGRCTDVYWKQGKAYRLLFAKAETSYKNQLGETVAICRQGVVYRFRQP